MINLIQNDAENLIPYSETENQKNNEKLQQLDALLDKITHLETLYQNSAASIQPINIEKYSPLIGNDSPYTLVI